LTPRYGRTAAVLLLAALGLGLGAALRCQTITEFPIPTEASSPAGITAGPDGDLRFAEFGGDKIGRITTAGIITEYPVPTAKSEPIRIMAGPDGNLWFTEINSTDGNKIGRITTGRRRLHVVPFRWGSLAAHAAEPQGAGRHGMNTRLLASFAVLFLAMTCGGAATPA
jgi:hypothetical protein